MTDTPTAAAGWYPDATGEMRYWDGHAWTGHTASNYQFASESSPKPAPADAVHGAERIEDQPWRRRWQFWLAIAVAAFLGLGAIANAAADNSTDKDSSKLSEPVDPVRVSDAPTSGTEPAEAPVALLFVTDQKDGDSWVASDGTEYRLGLVNAPERNEPCGSEATAFTAAFLGAGFTVDAYATDTHGRTVAEVFDESGDSLNVALAKSGLGNDRYLEEFRHENPELGRRIDGALAAADKADCRQKAVAPVPLVKKPTQTQKPVKDCMVGYSPCLPVVADLDCPEIGHPVTVTGSDPYRLDRDGDGIGCD